MNLMQHCIINSVTLNFVLGSQPNYNFLCIFFFNIAKNLALIILERGRPKEKFKTILSVVVP